MDNETRFHIQDLQNEISKLKATVSELEHSKDNLNSLVEKLSITAQDLITEIQILKQGGNL